MAFLTENQIWKILDDELELWSLTFPAGVSIRRGFQPTQQNTPTGLIAYIFQIMNERFGFQGSSDAWNGGTGKMDHTERYTVNKTLQISTQALTGVDAEYTSGDVAESIAAWFNSQVVIERMNAQKIGVIRITQVRHPHFVNDQDQYEGDPSFDMMITYCQEVKTDGVAIDSISGDIYNDETVSAI
jgi:hypothetical protein